MSERSRWVRVNFARVIASPSARVLFVHVQKTGGLTVEALLREALPDAHPITGLNDGKHAKLGTALRAHPELADYWTFGFVRNPWARLASWHAMIMRRHTGASSGNEVVAGRIRNNAFWSRVGAELPDLESFVLRGPDEFRRLRTPQIQYLRTGDRRADFIGRTESLDDGVRTVFEHLGLPLVEAAPRRNAGPIRDYREHFTPAMRDRVAEVFAADIRAFGYEF